MRREKPTIQAECLTKTMREVAEYCGIDTVRELVYYWPGCRLYIPRRRSDDSQLNLLGAARAEKLCAAFGGGTLEVPRNMFSPEGQAQMAHELQAQGYSQRDIALALNISQRQVRKIKDGQCRPSGGRRARLPLPGQMDLEDFLTKHG